MWLAAVTLASKVPAISPVWVRGVASVRNPAIPVLAHPASARLRHQEIKFSPMLHQTHLPRILVISPGHHRLPSQLLIRVKAVRLVTSKEKYEWSSDETYKNSLLPSYFAPLCVSVNFHLQIIGALTRRFTRNLDEFYTSTRLYNDDWREFFCCVISTIHLIGLGYSTRVWWTDSEYIIENNFGIRILCRFECSDEYSKIYGDNYWKYVE